MPAYLNTFNQILAYGAMLLQATILVLAVALIFFPKTNPIRVFFKEYTFTFSFFFAFSAVILSLFYSNVVGFPPCELCWISRITMYPLALLLGMEFYKKDKSILDHAIVLALLNVITSIYHVYIEHGGESALPCADPNVTTQVSCATRYVYEFGYVSMPVMALSVSFFVLLVLVNYKHSTRK